MTIDYRYSGPSRLGLRYCVDTNVVVDRSIRSDVDALFDLAADGWVSLVKADALDGERVVDDDADVTSERLEETAGIVELNGVWVAGYSRLGHFVGASPDDVAAFEEVWGALFPGVDRTQVRRNHVHDVMHVATARRYGCEAFVTSEKRLIQRGRRLDGIWIASPSDAVSRVIEMRRRFDIADSR